MPTPAFVQGNSAYFNTPPTNGLSCAYSAAVAAGDLLVAAGGWVDGGGGSITGTMADDQGNVWAPIGSQNHSDGLGYTQQVWWAIAASSATPTVALTLSASTTFVRLAVHEYSGVDALDQVANATGGSTTPTAGPVTTTHDNELVFGWAISNDGITGATGATIRETAGSESTSDSVAATAGSHSAAFTAGGASNWVAQVATFFDSASVGPNHYRLFPSTDGPASPITYSGNFIAGVGFTVTEGDQWFEGYWWWVAGAPQSTAPVKCCLWMEMTGGEGWPLLDSVVTSGTLTPGWNYIPLPEPIPLPMGGSMVAAIGVNGNFPDTSGWWGSNGPVVNGPLMAWAPGQESQGGTSWFAGGFGDPWGGANGCFSTAGTDPSAVMPAQVSGTDNFWVDVQVTDQAPSGYAGAYRLWPNLTVADAATESDSAVPYIVGTEVHVASTAELKRVWYFVPAGTSQILATAADVWSVDAGGTTGSSVVSNTTPVWKAFDGSDPTSMLASWPGAWVYCDMPATTLDPGVYKVSVYCSNGATKSWSSKRLSYWGIQSGAQAHLAVGLAGVTSGPLSAPASGRLAKAYGNETVTEPGQSTFQVGPPDQYPNLYVGTNSPGGNLYQNYWVDMEVGPVGPSRTDAATTVGHIAGSSAMGSARVTTRASVAAGHPSGQATVATPQVRTGATSVRVVAIGATAAVGAAAVAARTSVRPTTTTGTGFVRSPQVHIPLAAAFSVVRIGATGQVYRPTIHVPLTHGLVPPLTATVVGDGRLRATVTT